MNTDNCLFFYGGPLSQWYPSRFMLGGVGYVTAEQYMMAMKAHQFGDVVTHAAILHTDNPREQKALGRQVKGFDPLIWNQVAREIVYQGNVAKFSQNPELLRYLLSTDAKELVEASPTDTVWGIGIGMDDPLRFFRESWRGTNWLGLALMATRMKLRTI